MNWGVFNDKFYFFAGPRFALQLYSSDGTADGTTMLKDFNPEDITLDLGRGRNCDNSFVLFNDLLYFAASDAIHGCELWSTDGTSGGTAMVEDILLGTRPCESRESCYPGTIGQGALDGIKFKNQAAVFKGKLFFRANDGLHGEEMWSTDGTAGGAQLLKDIYPGKKLAGAV